MLVFRTNELIRCLSIILSEYYRVYKELNLCFLLLTNLRTQIAKKYSMDDILEFDKPCRFCKKRNVNNRFGRTALGMPNHERY